MARQESFNAYVGRELNNNAFEIGRVSDNMARVKGELKLISKYAFEVLNAQNDLLDELNNKNDFAVRVATRTSRMTQEPLYPEGHPRESSKILREII